VDPAESEALATPTEQPVPTATSLPPLVILLRPQESDPELGTQVQSLLETTTSQKGYRLEIRSSLAPEELTPDIVLVTALAPAPVSELAAVSSETRFLAVGYNDLPSAENINGLSIQALSPDRQGFMAGYMAAVISSDWRVGIISASDTSAGVEARQGFLMGAEYFCGLCRNVYPPYRDPNGSILEYPTFVELPAASQSQDWLGVVQTMTSRSVEVVYVAPGAGDQVML